MHQAIGMLALAVFLKQECNCHYPPQDIVYHLSHGSGVYHNVANARDPSQIPSDSYKKSTLASILGCRSAKSHIARFPSRAFPCPAKPSLMALAYTNSELAAQSYVPKHKKTPFPVTCFRFIAHPAASVHLHQGVRALGQRPQVAVPEDGAANQQDVVGHAPEHRHLSGGGGTVGAGGLLSGPGAHAAPDAGEAHAVAEGVDEADGEEGAGAEEEEGGEGAEEGGVGELEEGAGEGDDDGDVSVGDAELVEMVDVGEAEEHGREEDGGADRGAGQEHQRDGCRSEQDLFCHGALRKGGRENRASRVSRSVSFFSFSPYFYTSEKDEERHTATMFRQVVHSPRRPFRGLRSVQARQPLSTTRCSKRGPAKRPAVRSRARPVSGSPTGQSPIRRAASAAEAW